MELGQCHLSLGRGGACCPEHLRVPRRLRLLSQLVCLLGCRDLRLRRLTEKFVSVIEAASLDVSLGLNDQISCYGILWIKSCRLGLQPLVVIGDPIECFGEMLEGHILLAD